VSDPRVHIRSLKNNIEVCRHQLEPQRILPDASNAP